MNIKKTRSACRPAKRAAANGGARANAIGENKPLWIQCGLFSPIALPRGGQPNAQAFVSSWLRGFVRDK